MRKFVQKEIFKFVNTALCVCVCVCVRERERERARNFIKRFFKGLKIKENV